MGAEEVSKKSKTPEAKRILKSPSFPISMRSKNKGGKFSKEMVVTPLANALPQPKPTENQYEQLFDFAPIGLLILNAEAKIENSNYTASSILNIEKAELIGNSLSTLLPKREAKKLYLKLKEIEQQGFTAPFSLMITHPTIGTFPVYITGTRSNPDGNGKSLCHISIEDGTCHQKTELLKHTKDNLEWEKKTIKKYLDLAPVLFLLVDNDQKVQLINKKAIRIFGYSQKEVSGKDWFLRFIDPSKTIRDKYTYYNSENKKLQ